MFVLSCNLNFSFVPSDLEFERVNESEVIMRRLKWAFAACSYGFCNWLVLLIFFHIFTKVLHDWNYASVWLLVYKPLVIKLWSKKAIIIKYVYSLIVVGVEIEPNEHTYFLFEMV